MVITRFLPSSLRRMLQARRKQYSFRKSILCDYLYDFKRFLYSSAVEGDLSSKSKLRARLTIDYHKIEKGLSLRDRRVGFGSDVIQRLLENVQRYHTAYGADDIVLVVLSNLEEYYRFNRGHGHDDESLRQRIADLRSAIRAKEGAWAEEQEGEGGTHTVTREDIHRVACRDLSAFFAARHSIRHFGPGTVELDLIRDAVRMAQKTPSVCNRQSSKVYVFNDPDEKAQILKLQGGNRGFGDQADKVLIVTSDVSHFVFVGERNQCWIDGGMFAMSLIYALHSLGVGTCCLNWAKTRRGDEALKKAVGIPSQEAVIMLIAVGELPDELRVAQSPRKRLDDVLVDRTVGAALPVAIHG